MTARKAVTAKGTSKKSPAKKAPAKKTAAKKAPAKKAGAEETQMKTRIETHSPTVDANLGDDAHFAHKLDRLACDPIAIIAAIACDEGADLRLRFYAAKELATYLMVKPRQGTEAPPPVVDVGAIIARNWSPSSEPSSEQGEGP
jgi:hypothetical protein